MLNELKFNVNLVKKLRELYLIRTSELLDGFCFEKSSHKFNYHRWINKICLNTVKKIFLLNFNIIANNSWVIMIKNKIQIYLRTLRVEFFSIASANLWPVLSVSPTFVKLKDSRCEFISNPSNSWMNFSSEIFCKRKKK